MPGASVPVEIDSATGATSIVSGCSATRSAAQLSVARTTTAVVPHAAGVPVIDPVPASRDSPSGSDPDAIDQLTVPTFPLAVGVISYRWPARAAGDAGIVSENAGGSMVIESVALAAFPGQPASTACTAIVAVPIDCGTPLIVPVASSVRPEGSAPPASDQRVAPVPPVACRSALYIVW